MQATGGFGGCCVDSSPAGLDPWPEFSILDGGMRSTADPGLNYAVGAVIYDISYIFREEYGNCCRYVSCGLFLFRPYFAITDGGMSAAISVFISKLSKRLAYVNSPIRKLADRHCQQASGVRGSGQESSIKSLICMVRFFSRSLLPAFINCAFAKHYRCPSQPFNPPSCSGMEY